MRHGLLCVMIAAVVGLPGYGLCQTAPRGGGDAGAQNPPPARVGFQEKRSSKPFAADLTESDKAQIEKERQADAARRALFAPPPILPGQSIMLGSPPEPLPLSPLALHPAADFPAAAKWVGGHAVKLADLKGKVVLIYFWASWQDFDEHDLRTLATTSKTPDFKLPAAIRDRAAIVGVHVPTGDPERVKTAMAAHHMDFPVCIDAAVPGKAWGVMAEQYRLDELPTAYVIDPKRKVAALGNWTQAVRRAEELLGADDADTADNARTGG